MKKTLSFSLLALVLCSACEDLSQEGEGEVSGSTSMAEIAGIYTVLSEVAEVEDKLSKYSTTQLQPSAQNGQNQLVLNPMATYEWSRALDFASCRVKEKGRLNRSKSKLDFTFSSLECESSCSPSACEVERERLRQNQKRSYTFSVSVDSYLGQQVVLTGVSSAEMLSTLNVNSSLRLKSVQIVLRKIPGQY